jgi:hypothetical protein
MSVEKFNDGFSAAEEVPFTTVANIVVQNLMDPPALSIWIYLQSLPSDWKINKTHLRRHFGFGEKKLEKALSLLVKCKLLEYVRLRNDDGSFAKGFWRALNGSQFIHPDTLNEQSTTTPKTDGSGFPRPCEKGVHTKETVITNEKNKQNGFFENDSVKKVSELESMALDRLKDVKEIYPNCIGEDRALRKLKKMGKGDFNALIKNLPLYLEGLRICKNNGFNRSPLDLGTYIHNDKYKEAEKFLESIKSQYKNNNQSNDRDRGVI